MAGMSKFDLADRQLSADPRRSAVGVLGGRCEGESRSRLDRRALIDITDGRRGGVE